MRRTLIALVISGTGPLVGVLAANAATTAAVTVRGRAERQQRGAGRPGVEQGQGRADVEQGDRQGLLAVQAREDRRQADSAHIHKGKAGVSGNVVVPLGANYKREGCTSAAKSLVKSIAGHPGAYYVNVHNAKHPLGAMRGQL